MHGALFVAKTGLSAQDTNLKVISNNLANASTVGFKKDRAVFEDLLYQTVRQPGAASAEGSQLPSGLQLGSGVKTVGTQKMFTEGDLQITDQAFDVAINGRGFFQIMQPNGEMAYTRNGQFHVDSENRLVSAEGYVVQPEVIIPDQTETFTVGTDGTLSVQLAGQIDTNEIGQLLLADFVNPQGLQAIGQNLFTATGSSGAPNEVVPGETSIGILKQGALETSNVNAVEELVSMIQTQRAYEINSKVVSTADQMLSYVTQNM